MIERIIVTITDPHDTNWEPVTPIFLPKKPDDIEPRRGKIIIKKYII
jgi:hypothetical protein